LLWCASASGARKSAAPSSALQAIQPILIVRTSKNASVEAYQNPGNHPLIVIF
jgi:hypothetical protein